MTDHNSSTVISFDDALKIQTRKMLASKECRVASDREWSELLPFVRTAWRAINLKKLGSLADVSEDDAAAFLDQLGVTADYLEAMAIACNAACAIFTKALTAPGAPLATV